MHIDGAGVIGMKHTPYYPENVRSEAEVYTRLPVKNTFCKIHGLGRVIFQSYPTYENQGGNLLVEIVFRAIRIFMERKNKKVLRNVYIFLDNTNANKCKSLLTALSCLVLLGKCNDILHQCNE